MRRDISDGGRLQRLLDRQRCVQAGMPRRGAGPEEPLCRCWRETLSP